jgi:hypothetical protein
MLQFHYYCTSLMLLLMYRAFADHGLPKDESVCHIYRLLTFFSFTLDTKNGIINI